MVGSEPVTATSGKYAGISILQHEQNRGLDMLLALDSAQRDKAILKTPQTANYNLTEAFEDNEVLGYAATAWPAFQSPRATGFWISSIDSSGRSSDSNRKSSVCQGIGSRATSQQAPAGAAFARHTKTEPKAARPQSGPPVRPASMSSYPGASG